MDEFDRRMMQRAIALSVRSGEEGEYPYGVVVRRGDAVVAESINRIAHEHDVTRHAEVVALAQAQKALDRVSLNECTIYVSAEPCAICSLAIRETRIGRVIYALRSPHMGGVSKWPVLTDADLSDTIPEVFAPPPEIVAGFMAREAEDALMNWNPVMWGPIKARGIFVTGPLTIMRPTPPPSFWEHALALLRRNLFDRFGRN